MTDRAPDPAAPPAPAEAAPVAPADPSAPAAEPRGFLARRSAARVQSAQNPRPWRRYLVLGVVGVVLLVVIAVLMTSLLPRWWAGTVGRQASGTFSGGVGWGVFYGFVFTFVPLLIASLAFARRWASVGVRVVFIVLGVVLATPNLITLGIVVGTSAAAHAGERIFDVQAPGFRWTTLISAIVAVVLAAVVWVLSAIRRRAVGELKRLRAERELREGGVAADEKASRQATRAEQKLARSRARGPALTQAWVLHVDLDQFLAAVEILRHPDYAGLPVVVGGRGDPTERAVVSTASYEARAFGIRSGMALRTALKRCPDAIFLPVDFPTYEAASVQVMATLRRQPGAVVQVLGWDEAFVGISTDDPEAYATRLQADVLAATRLHCSVGIGDTTVRAKIATDFGKPQGRFRLTRDNWMAVMGERPTQALWGVGSRIAQRLAALGLHTVRDLATAEEDRLVVAFGPGTGPYLRRLGRGLGATVVDDTPWVARAHGRETTYQQDLVTSDEIAAAVRALADHVVADLTAEGRACARVHLKVRFVPFFTVSRIRKLPEPTLDPAVITDTALELLARLDEDPVTVERWGARTATGGRPIRLLGVRGEMVPPDGGY